MQNDEHLSSEREALRSSVFLSAVIEHEGASEPIRIRDISSGGALIEGANLPREGATVTITRHREIVDGTIVRRSAQAGGVRFSRKIDVEIWKNSKSAHQKKVDSILSRLRTEKASVSGKESGDDTDLSSSPLTSNELKDLAERLEDLSAVLSDEDTLVSKYPEKLQILDIAAQALRKLEAS